jgi:hypothetical protein
MQDVVQLTTNILIWTFGVDEKLTGAVERVGEIHARLWCEENQVRIPDQYL